MYAKFRVFLTLLVFVNVNLKALNANTAHEAAETNSGQRVAVPIAVDSNGEEVKFVAQTNNVVVTTTTIAPLPKARARSIADNNDDDDDFDDFDEHNLNAAYETHPKETSRPLKNVFRGIYKSYKSTYMGNVTSAEYKKRLIERLNAAAHTHVTSTKSTLPTSRAELSEQLVHERLKNETSLPLDTEVAPLVPLVPLVPPALAGEALKAKLKEKLRKRKRKYHRSPASAKRAKTNNRHLNTTTTDADKVNERASNNNNTANSINVNGATLDGAQRTLNGTFSDKHYRYTIGPGVNMSFDMVNDIVNVNLDSDNLVEIMRGHWLNDNTEEGE